MHELGVEAVRSVVKNGVQQGVSVSLLAPGGLGEAASYTQQYKYWPRRYRPPKRKWAVVRVRRGILIYFGDANRQLTVTEKRENVWNVVFRSMEH